MSATLPQEPGALGLAELTPAKRAWSRWLSQGVSVVLLIAVLFQLRHIAPGQWRDALPDSLWFWPALLALYLSQPAADWVIFRRLWKLPLAGLPVLAGKRIANELLMYSGEAYFYLWARKRSDLPAAPFGAIKDVNILSALAGNVFALALMLAAWPVLARLPLGGYAGAAVGSALAMLAVSLAILVASRRLFILTKPQFLEVCLVHAVRLAVGVVLWALLGALALPKTPLSLWLALSAVRLLVARLPFVPHKDLLFATAAALLLGEDVEVAAFVAMVSVAILVLHLIFGAGLAIGAFCLGGKARPR